MQSPQPIPAGLISRRRLLGSTLELAAYMLPGIWGIDPDTMLRDEQGWRIPILPDAKPIAELVA